MIMSDVFAILFLHLGVMIVLPGLWLTARAAFPRWSAGSEAAMREMPVRTAGLGLLLGAAWFGLSIAAGASALPFLAGLGLTTFFLYALSGLSGVVTHLGNRLPSPADRDRPWKATLRGGIALELTFALPLVGWFIILPLALASGVGGGTISILRRFFGSDRPPPAGGPAAAARMDPVVAAAVAHAEIPAGI
ncbi:MAG: hypothetical protein L0216_05095 [Planctomycetales bacterium]|nr:hypothetical protein [Planctomycetales bacterium]